ncbi:class I SAM-dependent methyltransferase [Amycolatopsis suaedae]|uniref:Class I SAM-dependent methyltransferase n=1 Tax=Amycolatopsis suaedae TaxID=2510978 RepID=A0A4V2EL60_9PSEU|nr:class I SAM-dependent methyltransferase [Amycolatopsis suaedae]RZQ60435.1 class I SAM-dependent methyltransferase [Amycolatopsis suaedae]
MPFNHNDHYHPLLLRHVPAGARTALDVGCGLGTFARRLAATGLEVTGLDASREMVSAARALGPDTVTYRHADVTAEDLPAGGYDFVSCLAALHHMPFETVAKLRDALAPGGVLVVLGMARARKVREFAAWTAAVALDQPPKLAVRLGERLNGGAAPLPVMPMRDPDQTMTQVRRESARLLPGSSVRVLLFWRYLLTYRAPVA